jgi:hypothetical protein
MAHSSPILVELLEPRTLLAVAFDRVMTLGFPGESENVVAVGTDSADNFYIAGQFRGTVDFDPGPGTKLVTAADDLDVFVAKYSAAGALVWVRRFGGKHDDHLAGMAVSPSGQVALAGTFSRELDLNPAAGAGAIHMVRSNGDTDVYVVKLDAAGKFVWGGSIGGRHGDSVAGVAITPAGGVYLGGLYLLRADLDPGAPTLVVNSTDTAGVYLLKIGASGDLLWHRELNGDPDKSAFVRIASLTVGPGGDLYATGTFARRIDFDPGAGRAFKRADGLDAYVLRLSGAGQFTWVDTFGAGGSVRPVRIKTDSAGNIFLAGQFTDEPDFNPSPEVLILSAVSGGQGTFVGDIFLSKFSSSGKLRFADQIGGPDAALQLGDLFVDSAGYAYLAGAYNDLVDFDPGPGLAILTNGSNDSTSLQINTIDGANAFLAKIGPKGGFKSVTRIGNDDGLSIATAIAVDSAGAIHAAGLFTKQVDFDPGAGTALRLTDDEGDIFVLSLSQ